MAGARDPLRLRDWLVAQIESGRYAGLRWEDAGKTLFRIPWKHAARQGYRAQQDAALFRAWAIHKGKHLEGIDKEDPPTWKTRLRCALNKSADFREVRERHQLDSPDPYKVYRIVADGARGPVARAPAPPEKNILRSQQEPPGEVTELACGTHQDGSRSTTEDKDKEQPPRLAQQGSLPPAARLPAPLADHGYHAQDPTHHWSHLPSEDFSNPDCWLHVRLFYGATLVREATARTAEGCRLSPGPTLAAAERLLGPPPRVAQVRFPEPPPGARELQHLLRHLERGVLLWVAPEGVFAKRLCRGRVYWRGPLAPHRARPNKLERERTCQLLDTRRFLEGRSPGARVPNPSVLWRGVPRAPRAARGAAHHGPRGASLRPRALPALKAPLPWFPSGGRSPAQHLRWCHSPADAAEPAIKGHFLLSYHPKSHPLRGCGPPPPDLPKLPVDLGLSPTHRPGPWGQRKQILSAAETQPRNAARGRTAHSWAWEVRRKPNSTLRFRKQQSGQKQAFISR